jgi:hypothetical protein
MNRVELETKLNDGPNWLLARYGSLSEGQILRPMTESQHDPENHWTPLNDLAHMALVERNFNAMVKRHVGGSSNPVGFMLDAEGKPRTRDEIMADVHADTEKWQLAHRDRSFSDVVALTASMRSATLQLNSELSDSQLEEILPTAPWADGSVAGILGANADQGHMHWRWLKEAGIDERVDDNL